MRITPIAALAFAGLLSTAVFAQDTDTTRGTNGADGTHNSQERNRQNDGMDSGTDTSRGGNHSDTMPRMGNGPGTGTGGGAGMGTDTGTATDPGTDTGSGTGMGGGQQGGAGGSR